MPTPYQILQQGLMPAKSDYLAAAQSIALPFGGPVGVGGPYAMGQCVGIVGGAQASAVVTATVTTNSSVGMKGYFTYASGEKTYYGLTATGGITANLSSVYPTAAQMQAALVATVPQWSGNVTVTGSTGGPYTITFNNLMANKRWGGLLTFTVSTAGAGGTPTVAITISTAGSCGAGQFDLYSNGGTPNRVDGFLMYSLYLDPTGSISGGEFPAPGQPGNGYPAWTSGFFFADQTNFPEKSVLTGSGLGLLDANAFTVSASKLAYYYGTSLNDPGVMIGLQ